MLDWSVGDRLQRSTGSVDYERETVLGLEELMRPPLLEDYVVPICSASISAGRAQLSRLLGTSFFVDDRGVFLTAKHVLKETSNDSDAECYGLVVKPKTSNESILRPIVEWECGPSPYDVAIGMVDFPSRPWFSIDSVDYAAPWKDIATLGYPESALNHTVDKFNIHIRALKGYIQRFVAADEIDLIRPHPDCYELSFPITLGMSGAPLFSAEGNRQELIGICTGSYDAAVVAYLTKEISEGNLQFQEQHLKVEQIGIAQSILPLLEWSPSTLSGRCLGECFRSSVA